MVYLTPLKKKPSSKKQKGINVDKESKAYRFCIKLITQPVTTEVIICWSKLET